MRPRSRANVLVAPLVALALALPLALTLTLDAANAANAAPPAEPGTMLREGVWGDGVGQFELPASLRAVPPSSWPREGWYRISTEKAGVRSERLTVERGQAPPFLASIAAQLGTPAADTMVEFPNRIFLRVPDVQLREGTLATYRFRNGTSRLTPTLDFRYELELDGQPFAFTVQNGRRTASGASYGSGALYTIEYDGNRYEYLLGELGWDSHIEAIADLDGDGKPDFIVHVAGNNTGYEAVLLSSKARPGRNVPTASLVQGGC